MFSEKRSESLIAALQEESPDEYYMPNQYANPDNVLAHFETTGPEIYRQTEGEIDYFVAGMGTGGTLMGTGAFLRSRKKDVKIVGMSSGAAVEGAIRLARRISSGTIVTLLPDRGDRYLSTSLFRSTCGACPP